MRTPLATLMHQLDVRYPRPFRPRPWPAAAPGWLVLAWGPDGSPACACMLTQPCCRAHGLRYMMEVRN